jgi:P4 family phage/plasmid primase-like protien
MADWNSAGNGRLAKAASWYANKDWKVLPCHGIEDGGRCTCSSPHGEPKDVGKHPAIREWNINASSDAATVGGWWARNPEYNIGVFAGPSGFLVIDIDPRSGGLESFEKFEELLEGVLPSTVEAETGVYTHNGKAVRGRHLYFKCDPDEALIGNLLKNGLKGIDIKHNGYVLVAPSRHFSGIIYDWREGHAPWEMEMAEAPEELLQVLRKNARRSGSTSYGTGEFDWMEGLDAGGERVDIQKLLEDGIDEGARAVEIYRLACALANKFGTTPDARMMIETMMIRFNHEKVRPPMELEGENSLLMHTRNAIQFVANNPKIARINPQAAEWAQRANSAEAQAEILAAGGPIQRLPNAVGNAVTTAVESGSSVREAISNGNLDIPQDPDAILPEDGGTPGRRSLSDTGNGRRFVDTFGSAVRYTPGLGWFHWDGTYWKPDVESLEMQELAKTVSSVIASEIAQYEGNTDKQSEIIKWAAQGKSNTRINNMITSANSDPRVVVGVEQWDSDVNLLGVQNGVIDLKTGELLKGQPNLYITRRAPVAYNPGLRNPRWEQFIDFATGGDKELQNWLQKAVGYTLTGNNNHDLMFLVYGPPGSGKNTFVEAIVKALGTKQYAWPLDSAVLAANDGSANRSDEYHWAQLRGRRMVWVDELPESERLKENAVKKLTGSSEISARSPGEQPFTFEAQAKLWVTTNHRPAIMDDAMWRRLRPIPWSNVPEKPDPDLKAYLFDVEGGLPGVLAWAVEGAVKYLGSSARDALGMCTAVEEASSIYRKEQDRIGLFVEEELAESEGNEIAVKKIYSTYKMWCGERGEYPLSQANFQRRLADRGLTLTGHGTNAVLKNYFTKPRVVPDGVVDYSHLSRTAGDF